MPFTPFHFGPSACVSLPLKRYIDVPIFILANIAVDIEPLLVMTLGLPFPLHGIAHTLLGATLIGIGVGVAANSVKKHLNQIARTLLKLTYITSLKKYILSGILGCWFHILLDSPLYTDIKPLYPFSDTNPFLGITQGELMYTICVYSFLLVAAIYGSILIIKNKKY